jgi:hypothetical protein
MFVDDIYVDTTNCSIFYSKANIGKSGYIMKTIVCLILNYRQTKMPQLLMHYGTDKI